MALPTQLPIPQPPSQNKFGGAENVNYLCVMERTIKLSELAITGNLKPVFENLEKLVQQCEGEGYSDRVGKAIKIVVEFGFTDCEFWFEEIQSEDERPEIEAILLIGHIFIIRLNNIAQKHLNGIEMPSIAEQLSENPDIQKYFKDVIFL